MNGTPNQQIEEDIRMAARSTAPILITATPDCALIIARRILAADTHLNPNVLLCDPAADRDRRLDVLSRLERP